jgi:glycosyltransferase involved in cell wall biosynthesis
LRILLLSQWFDPERFFKGLVFAKELQRRGHEVEVLTGFPNYPGGKLYPGYRVRPWQREVMGGVLVTRVALYPSHDRSAWKRILNYLSFAASAGLLGPWLVRRPDVIYVYHPPLTVGVAAMALSLLLRAPFVYDVQDLWPDTLAATGMVRWGVALRVVDWWSRLVYRRAARIAVLSPGFKWALVRRGVPEEKIEVIYNWSDEEVLRGSEGGGSSRAELGMGPGFVVLFAGTMGMAQGLDTVLGAAQLCVERGIPVEFVMAGGGVERERLEAKAAAMGLGNVRFVGRIPAERIGGYLAAADALLVHLKDDPLFRITIPSKTQAYLAMGRPLLMGVAGDAGVLVKRAGAGIVFAPEDAGAMVNAIERLAGMDEAERAEMGATGRRFYDRELAMGVGVAQFERLLRAAAG